MSQPNFKSSPSLAIVIVNWNSFAVTANCLESLRAVKYENFTTIVVDNGSEDDSVEQFRTNFPEVTVLENQENRGFTGGNNTGIQYSLDQSFDYIMLLNNDTVVPADFAGKLVQRLEQDTTLGAVQPKIMYNQEREVIWNAGGIFKPFFFRFKTRGLDETDQGQYDTAREIDWVTGCCFLTRRSIVEEIGLLDDKFFIYYEDSDWSFKIRRLGYKLFYEPAARVYHEVGMSNQNRKGHNEGTVSPFTYHMILRNHLFMVRRYARGINKIGAYTNQALKVSKYIAYFIIRRRFTKLRAAIRGVREGLTK